MAEETLRHPNYAELMGFVTSVYKELVQPGSEIKKVLTLVGSPAPAAFQQAMIEVDQKDGGFGMSHMPAKVWFNNDLALRQAWSDQIAALYEVYKTATVETVEAVAANDPVVTELEALKAQIAALADAMNKLVASEGSETEPAAESVAETPAAEDVEEKAADQPKGE